MYPCHQYSTPKERSSFSGNTSSSASPSSAIRHRRGIYGIAYPQVQLPPRNVVVHLFDVLVIGRRRRQFIVMAFTESHILQPFCNVNLCESFFVHLCAAHVARQRKDAAAANSGDANSSSSSSGNSSSSSSSSALSASTQQSSSSSATPFGSSSSSSGDSGGFRAPLFEYDDLAEPDDIIKLRLQKLRKVPQTLPNIS